MIRFIILTQTIENKGKPVVYIRQHSNGHLEESRSVRENDKVRTASFQESSSLLIDITFNIVDISSNNKIIIVKMIIIIRYQTTTAYIIKKDCLIE